ncbi:hypothetical protein AB0368_03745 [Actinoplanes sp. NPDC051475]|uniref:hypothetical protein n=1 Tax=Actinoplanes sp. NPDC051475 TaxID=3157225 RepID=UPI00344FB87D
MSITAQPGDRLVYGLRRPTLDDARESLRRSVADPAAAWQELLTQTGLTGAETDAGSVASMARAMVGSGGFIGLCGNALSIRITAYTALGAVEELFAAA